MKRTRAGRPAPAGAGGPFRAARAAYLEEEPVAGTRPYADETQRLIDREVTRLLTDAARRAGALLAGHRSALDRLTQLLVDRETVDGEVVYGLVAAKPLGLAAPAAAESTKSG